MQLQPSHPFIAIFCPNCGACVNEPSDRAEYERPPFVNCGWCKQRHGLDGVIVCRNLKHLTEAQFVAGGLMAMRRSLLERRKILTMSLMADAFVNLPPFTAEEVEELLISVQERRVGIDEGGTTDEKQRIPLLWSLETALSEGLGSYRRLQPAQNPD